MRKTELEAKREMAQKIAPEIKSLIKKYGYEAVAYTWKQAVEKQRQAKKIRAEIQELEAQKRELERSLVE